MELRCLLLLKTTTLLRTKSSSSSAFCADHECILCAHLVFASQRCSLSQRNVPMDKVSTTSASLLDIQCAAISLCVRTLTFGSAFVHNQKRGEAREFLYAFSVDAHSKTHIDISHSIGCARRGQSTIRRRHVQLIWADLLRAWEEMYMGKLGVWDFLYTFLYS